MTKGPTQFFVLAYGTAHFGKSLFWYAGEVLFAFFLTEVCHLSAWTMAWVLSASIAVNAISDIVTGSRFGHWIQSAAKAASGQWKGAVVSGLCLSAFLVSSFVPDDFRTAYAVTTLCFYRISYAFYDVPQNVMLAFTAHTERDRGQLSALRLFGSGLANTLLSLLFVPFIANRPPHLQGPIFGGLALAMTVIAITTAAILARSVASQGEWSRHKSIEQAPPSPRTTWLPVLCLLGVNFTFTGTTTIFTRLEPYFAAYGAASRGTGATVMLMVALGGILAQPVFGYLIARMTCTIEFPDAKKWRPAAFYRRQDRRCPWGAHPCLDQATGNCH